MSVSRYEDIEQLKTRLKYYQIKQEGNPLNPDRLNKLKIQDKESCLIYIFIIAITIAKNKKEYSLSDIEKQYEGLTRKQREVARQVANKIICKMADAERQIHLPDVVGVV